MARKPAPPNTTTPGKKNPARPLPREREPKPLAKPRQLQRERLLAQLHDLTVACEELFDEHGIECDCETCSVVSNFVGALRLFRLVLEIS
jgi:hypothetical protein